MKILKAGHYKSKLVVTIVLKSSDLIIHINESLSLKFLFFFLTIQKVN